MTINIPETCGEVECAVRGRLTSGGTEFCRIENNNRTCKKEKKQEQE